ncbi:unnamed protein product [Paramecium octaurelia]|uniref:Uncharacterized protein n=1 Tax=Paramecium octaurelia TaxID=43137 RepID=A0A8S1WTB4_PAROT|nr:unnamed protein product [Paramecium octaurelia]CAD8192466.1 unnamed protein product [Paramecium octaurelia]
MLQELQSLKERKESLKNQRIALEEELNQLLSYLEQGSKKQSDAYNVKCLSTEFEIKKKEIQKQMEKESQEIIKNQQYCTEQQRVYKERADWIDKFNDKLKEDFKSCQKKEETIQIRSTVAKGIKRLFLLQLCTIFFDKENQRLLWGLHKIKFLNDGQQNITSQEEDQLATSLGYLGLLLQQIAKIKGVTLKYEFKFKGSKSYIQQQNDTLYLFSQKPSNLKVLKQSSGLLIQNLYIIMEELSVQKQWRNQSLPTIIGKIGEMLWVDA